MKRIFILLSVLVFGAVATVARAAEPAIPEGIFLERQTESQQLARDFLIGAKVHDGEGKIIGDVVSLMKLRAQDKGIRLLVDYEGAIPETIQTDMVRLRQILVKLVGNAVKFTEQGTIHIVTRFVDEDRDCSKLEIEVSDTGCTNHWNREVFLPCVAGFLPLSEAMAG